MLNGKLILGFMAGGTGTVFPFNEVFNNGVDLMSRGFDNVDAIVVWGGEDISSSYYGEKPNKANQNSKGIPSDRDVREYKAMVYARANNIPIIGVCRGAQLLCAFAGGKLVQHVTGHHNNHFVATTDGRDLYTSSCHHQMMYPWTAPEYEILAWSKKNESTTYEGVDQQREDMKKRCEPEVVYFPRVNGLAIQGHPEWMEADSPFVKYCNDLVRKRLLTKEEVEA